MRGRVVVVLGMPGVGKTTVALALARALGAAGQACLVLHTDVLKVTLRALGVQGLRGPGYAPGVSPRLEVVRPVLQAHADKARRDGYTLIMEGTLAMGFPGDHVFVLESSHEVRQGRIVGKHESARASLEGASLQEYEDLMGQISGQRVDASGAPDDVARSLVEACLASS